MFSFSLWAFLDFDGVTHPFFPRADLTDAQNQHFSFLPAIEAVLRRHPNVGVVIASSWRHHYPMEVLRAKFGQDLQDRVVGATPAIPPPMGHGDEGSRQAEVEAWLAAHGQQGAPWVAIEDMVHLYRPGAAVVVAPDFFGEAEAALLEEALEDPARYALRHPVPTPVSK